MCRAAALPINLDIRFLGIDIARPQEHRIDRPTGTGDWLFLHFRTPVLLRDTRGTLVRPAGTVILFSPGRPQWYHGTGSGYRIDYCHFAGRDALRLVRAYRIPCDRAIGPSRPEPFAALMRALAAEHLRHDAHWKDLCALMLAQILIAVGRSATNAPRGVTSRQAHLAERLRDLRMRVHQDLLRHWTIASMAALVPLSPSRFSHVYRLHFGLSPMADLIEARIAHARWILASEPVAVKQAAAQSGFSDVHYFSRVFRSHTGCSPQAFARRRIGATTGHDAATPLENLRLKT